MTGADRWAHAAHPDSEMAAASYLGGALRPRAARAFERHLLACELCWREVEDGRAGRRLAESARQVAPPQLRERLRGVIASQALAGPGEHDRTSSVPGAAARRARWRVRSRPAPPALARWRVRSWPAPPARARRAGLGLVVLVAGLLVVLPGGAGRPAPVGVPRSVVAAVADYRAVRLPGARVPDAAAPDLSPVHLYPMGAAAGVVGGRPVTAYAYRDPAGRDVLLYRSADPFPTVVGARRLAGPDGAWVATITGVTVLCARSPHALLVLGLDRQLVLGVARTLDVA